MDPILTKYVGEPNSFTLDFFLQHEGYEGLKKSLGMQPNDVIETVKASGLRGRGGAGFPTGMKWQFVLKNTPLPKYICCNADESEPGTFKDHVLMERNPHSLFEGCLIGCWAIGAKMAYIYIRGEFYHVQKLMEAELAKARDRLRDVLLVSPVTHAPEATRVVLVEHLALSPPLAARPHDIQVEVVRDIVEVRVILLPVAFVCELESALQMLLRGSRVGVGSAAIGRQSGRFGAGAAPRQAKAGTDAQGGQQNAGS